MTEYQQNDTIVLYEGAEPVSTIESDIFEEQIEGDTYWGLPIDLFNIRGNKVYMDSELASSLKWTVDGVMPDMLNIAAMPQKVQLEERELSINPGFWCSNVKKSQVKEIIRRHN